MTFSKFGLMLYIGFDVNNRKFYSTNVKLSLFMQINHLQLVIFCFRKLTTEKQNVNALLTKYARSSTVGGVRYYGARHGK